MFEDIKKLFKHTLIYGSGVILTKAVGFLLIPVYTRCLTPKDYGILELLDTTVYFVGIIASMSITAAIFRYYYAYNEVPQKKKVISSAFLLVGSVSTIFTAIFVIFSKYVSALILGDATFYNFVVMILFANLLDMQNGMILSYIQVQKKSVFYTVISIARLTLALALNILFIVYLKIGVTGVLLSSLISAGTLFLCLFVYVSRNIEFSFSRKIAKEMVRYSIPLVPATIFMFLLHFMDRYILKAYLPLEIVGIYSLGYKFGFIVQFLLTGPFNRIWGVYAFELHNENKAIMIYPKILTYYCLVTLSFWLLISISIKPILRIMTGEAFWGAYKVVPLVSLGYVFLGLSYIFESGIHIKKRTYLNLISTGISLIVCLIFNFLLIPHIGMMGSAWATLFSFVVLATITSTFSIKVYPISYEWARLGKLFFVAILIYYLSQLINSDKISISLFSKIFFFMLFPFLLFLFNFFERKELIKLQELFLITFTRVRAMVCLKRT